MNSKLWYNKPAKGWKEGLPIGTGRLAAMVLGYIEEERIALNHEWLWRGKTKYRDIEIQHYNLHKVRELLLDGKYEEGTLSCYRDFCGGGDDFENPGRVDKYQPAGDLHFKLKQGEVNNYYRELNMDTGVVTVRYETESDTIVRQTVADLVNDLLIVRIKSLNNNLSGSFWLDRIEDKDCDILKTVESNTLNMKGSFKGGNDFIVKAELRVKNGDLVHNGDNTIQVNDASEIVVFINIGTSAKGEKPEEECNRYKIPNLTWEKLLQEHLKEYSNNYGALKLELECKEKNIPTNERISDYRQGKEDVGLELLYFNYGRYLLCACSANAELPANLQGKWNEEIEPAWDCDYHHDINIQMNYWIAETGNLHKHTEVLFDYLERFIPHGKEVAKKIYNCNGIYLPITGDPWGKANPELIGWAAWIGAAPWLAQHMWWHYEYGLDEKFLRNRAYPFIKEVAAFYESYLIKDSNGIYQIIPSQSPENRFVGSGELEVSLCISSTMDIQLVMDLLIHAIKGAKILCIDENKITIWQGILDHLPKMKVGSKGQLLEWNEEFEECEPGHRHISHLFGLFPADIITENSSELWEAARVALENRLSTGGGHTGWSRAWTACCFARLGDGEKARYHLKTLITDFATDSLLDLHPPRIFQIDGNLGGAAAVLEMIFQSYHEVLDFLPALPNEWKQGKIYGIRGRGGYSVNIEWKNNQLVCAEVMAIKDKICKIKCKDNDYVIKDDQDQLIKYKKDGNLLTFEIKSGKKYFVL